MHDTSFVRAQWDRTMSEINWWCKCHTLDSYANAERRKDVHGYCCILNEHENELDNWQRSTMNTDEAPQLYEETAANWCMRTKNRVGVCKWDCVSIQWSHCHFGIWIQEYNFFRKCLFEIIFDQRFIYLKKINILHTHATPITICATSAIIKVLMVTR